MSNSIFDPSIADIERILNEISILFDNNRLSPEERIIISKVLEHGVRKTAKINDLNIDETEINFYYSSVCNTLKFHFWWDDYIPMSVPFKS
jgi:hypothetical protein